MKPVKALFLLTTLILTANGQQKDSLQVRDTSENRPQVYNSDLLIDKPLFLRSAPANIIYENLRSHNNPEIIYRPAPIPLPPLCQQLKVDMGIESIWKKELSRQEEYKTLKTIMMSVQAGGVAYLAYLHLKKYGWK